MLNPAPPVPDLPLGWKKEIVNHCVEYSRIRRNGPAMEKLRVRELGTTDSRAYAAYRGAIYRGSFPELRAAIRATERSANRGGATF